MRTEKSRLIGTHFLKSTDRGTIKAMKESRQASPD
jgi:hypothetical protein